MISRGFVNYREWRLAHLVSSCVSHKRVALDVQILKCINNHIVIFDIDLILIHIFIDIDRLIKIC